MWYCLPYFLYRNHNILMKGIPIKQFLFLNLGTIYEHTENTGDLTQNYLFDSLITYLEIYRLFQKPL